MSPVKKTTHALLLLASVWLAGCSSTPELGADAQEPLLPIVNQQELDSDMEKDPWQGFNRRMYYFNYHADRYVILPVVNGYQWIMPDIAQAGVNNFFSNIGEINTFLNSLLQFKFTRAGKTAGRFAINSTIGILGLWDPATEMELYQEKEDFGQTLGHWGVGNGPYLVLPLLGPSSVRDGVGLAVDTFVYNELIDELDMHWEEEWALNILRAINARAQVPFRYYGTGSAFEYELVRDLYLRGRELQVQR